MRILNNLHVNDAQYQAITHGAGAMLVLAGPGSGKTFVTTQRIKYLIEHHHVKPEDILVITFTKAAALEMQERFVRLNEGHNHPVHFGTFHAIFFQILRYTYKFTAENIIKEKDKYRLLSQVLEEMPPEICPQLTESGENDNIAAKMDDAGNNTETLQRLLSEISKVKNNGISPQEHESETVSQAEFEYIYQAYKHKMNQYRLVDFEDMVLLCRDLLVSRPDTLKMWQERFRYILVDEFQDICPLQYEVVRLLAKPQDNLFIVGDDDQSIYGFRGSKPEIMLNFTKDYPTAQQILLNVNYRSKKDIVETAGLLIAHNQVRFAKKVMTQDHRMDGVQIYAFSSKQKQAENIALLIRQYMNRPNAHYRDIALLYRTNNHIVYTADKLIQENIPFTMKEKPKNIYDSAVAKDIIAYLRYALYEESLEDFFRIMNRPVRYIKRMTVPNAPFCMQQLLENNRTTEYVLQNIRELYCQLAFIRQLNPFSAVNFIRKGIGYDNYIMKQVKEKGKDAKTEMEELEELSLLSKDFETVREWLDHIENCDAVVHTMLQQKNQEDDAVNIVTMHAAKGLEWKVVILPDVNEGSVPHKKAVKDEEIEEERRMFYVAMTRAKEHLFIFYIHEKEAGNLLPSRFLDELGMDY